MVLPNLPVYLANPDVVCCQEEPDGNAILQNPDTNAFLGVNPTGLLLLRTLARPYTHDQLVAFLISRCADTSCEQVAVDVDAFLHSLLPKGFIGQVPGLAIVEFEILEQMTVISSDEEAPAGCDNPAAEDTGTDSLRFYRGHSMLGTFRPGDQLLIEPMPMERIKPGDVVVYHGRKRAAKESDVVHRVVAVTPHGLVTRGDNNPSVDPIPVTQARFIGRVTHRRRAGQVLPVPGGFWGRLHVGLFRAGLILQQFGGSSIRAAGRRTYRWVRETGLVRRFWRPAALRVLVATRSGPLVKYVIRQKTVAKWWPETGRFWCQQPYDLIIQRPGRMKI